MTQETSFAAAWIRLGVLCGALAVLIYPALILIPMPAFLTVILASAFGPLLSLASVGLYLMIALHKRTVSLQIAMVSNIIAGAVVTLMFLVQMGVNMYMTEEVKAPPGALPADVLKSMWLVVDQVQLGLDVGWDIFVGLGTFLFAVNMMKHPRFGIVFGWSGAAVSILLLALNLYTFPTPPADASLFDMGPLVGLWYAAVTVQVYRSLGWVDSSTAPEVL
jgi:hypothetical protein